MNHTLTVGMALIVGGVLGYIAGTYHLPMPATMAFDTDREAQAGAALAPISLMPGRCRPSDMVARLYGKSGRDLERVYLEDMIAYRTAEVEMAKVVGGQTAWPELRTFSLNVITSHTRDIQLMKEWLMYWYSGK
jgi:uncharacterized protein (DUF305 family)